MALEITSSENVDIGLLLEDVNGILKTGSAYTVFETQGGELDFPTEEARDTTAGDHGGPKDKRTTTRGGNANFPAHLRFDGNKELMASALRDAWSSVVNVIGSADIDIVINGTHQDGETNQIQIQAPTGTFNALFTYGGATANGVEGLLMLSTGWVNDANNQPMMIKAAWHDPAARAAAGQDNLDIFAGYGAAVKDDGGGITSPDTDALFGAPKIAEALSSPTLWFGSRIQNHQSGARVRDSYSILVDFFTHDDRARFMALRGWTGNDMNVSINGKGEVIVNVTGNGRGWSPLDRLPQNGQAIDSHLDFSALTANRMYIGADDLQFVGIATHANRINTTPVSILLSDSNVSQFGLNVAGNVAVETGIIGTDEQVPRTGMHDPTGSFSWYNTPYLIAEQITRLGAKGTAQRGGVHVGLKDEADQWVIFTYPMVNFTQTGPSPGAVGNAVSGTQNFGGMALSRNGRAVSVQQIDQGA